jgi:hypothetical protein
MRILLHRADGKTEPWIKDFAKYLPDAEIVVWHAGEKCQNCDYAVVWSPPEAMLPELAMVKAIFVTGAGVDALLKFGDVILSPVPIIRLEDAGMAVQMAEYVTHAVLRYFRRFDEYEAQARAASGRRCRSITRKISPSACWAWACWARACSKAWRRSAFRCAPGAAPKKPCRACSATTAPRGWTPSCAAAACWSACCR